MFDESLDRATAAGNSKCTLPSIPDRIASSATTKRDEAYTLAISSDDELFHAYLYDWHVARRLQEQLLEVKI